MAEIHAKKILVVDDEKETVLYLTSILRRVNYEVISATSGQEAVGLAKERLPDLIVLDIVLPDIDGGEVASILSKDPATADIPIIFLTGIIRKEEALSVEKSGKHCVMAKPVTGEELTQRIDKLLLR